MNNLEQEIWDRYGNFELSHDKNKLIVENINEFIEKHCIGFLKFIEGVYGFGNVAGLWYRYANINDEYTTEQLFNLYIEQL